MNTQLDHNCKGLTWPVSEPTRKCTCKHSIEVYCGMPQADARLDRRRKGVFGPPQGVRAIVFLDDLSMPLPEQYGAQVHLTGYSTC